MKKWEKILLKISVLFNVLIVLMLTIFLIKKGGVDYIISKFDNKLDKYSYQHNVYKSVFTNINTNNDDILFVGDSLTNYCSWNEIFNNENIKSRSIPGDKSSDLLDVLDVILKNNPKKIILMIGINDLSNGISQENVLENYNKIIGIVKDKSPQTELIIQSLLPINESILKDTKTNNVQIVNFNLNLKSICDENGIKYIDLYSYFLEDNQLKEELTVDGIHINGDGYLIWKKIIEPYLNS